MFVNKMYLQNETMNMHVELRGFQAIVAVRGNKENLVMKRRLRTSGVVSFITA